MAVWGTDGTRAELLNRRALESGALDFELQLPVSTSLQASFIIPAPDHMAVPPMGGERDGAKTGELGPPSSHLSLEHQQIMGLHLKLLGTLLA